MRNRPSIGLVVAGRRATDAAVAATVGSAVEAAARPPDDVVVVDRSVSGLPRNPAVTATDSWAKLRTDWLVFVQAGGLLMPETLEAIGRVVVDRPEVDLVYVDDVGRAAADPMRLVDPAHRPGFSPDRLRAQMYLGDLLAVRRTVALQCDPEGTILRSPLARHHAVSLATRCRTVAHLPRVLYRRPESIGRPMAAGRERADVDELNRLLEATGFPGRVIGPEPARAPAAGPPAAEIVPRLQRHPMVSIVIPTMGTSRSIGAPDGEAQTEVVLVEQAIESIVGRSTYTNFEIVVVTTPGTPADVTERLQAGRSEATVDDRPVRVRHDDRSFNFSNACNRGATDAAGRVLVFLNDDTIVITHDWLERLVMYASQREIGAVGARLLYEDGRIQHAGIWTRGGHPTHRYEGFPADHPGYRTGLAVPQNCLAVTGACLAVEAGKFDAVGGFSPVFPSSYNDVDLCLKLVDAGFRTVVDPGTVLSHLEASSRDPSVEDWELAALHERWRHLINRDPFDNPNHVAPLSDEFPPPDPEIGERNRHRADAEFEPRFWPLDRLTTV